MHAPPGARCTRRQPSTRVRSRSRAPSDGARPKSEGQRAGAVGQEGRGLPWTALRIDARTDRACSRGRNAPIEEGHRRPHRDTADSLRPSNVVRLVRQIPRLIAPSVQQQSGRNADRSSHAASRFLKASRHSRTKSHTTNGARAGSTAPKHNRCGDVGGRARHCIQSKPSGGAAATTSARNAPSKRPICALRAQLGRPATGMRGESTL